MRLILRLTPPNWGHPGDEKPAPDQEVVEQWSAIPGMSWAGKLDAQSIVRVYGHISFQIDGGGQQDIDDKFLLAVSVKVNGDEAYRASKNLRRDQHYEPWPINAVALVEPGDCKVEIKARARLADSSRRMHSRHGTAPARLFYKESRYTGMWLEGTELT